MKSFFVTPPFREGQSARPLSVGCGVSRRTGRLWIETFPPQTHKPPHQTHQTGPRQRGPSSFGGRDTLCHPGQGSCPRALREGRRGTMACPHPCPDGRAAAERSTVRELPRTADIKKAGGFGHRLFHICQARALLVGLEEVLGTGRFGRVGVLLDELVHAGLGGGLLVHLAEADALLQVSARSTVALGELDVQRCVGLVVVEDGAVHGVESDRGM